MRKSSERWRSQGAIAIAFTLLAACDPGFTVQGDVLDGTGHPVAGVRFVFVAQPRHVQRSHRAREAPLIVGDLLQLRSIEA